MTIGIDIRVLGSDTKSGIEEYTENLLAHLLPLDKNIKFKLFHSSFQNNLKKYEWANLPNVEMFSFRFPNKLLFGLSKLFNHPHIDKLIGGADVFFSPHFLLAPLSPDCKRVTTFHDLSYSRFKEFFSWRRNLWHKFQIRPLVWSGLSDKIIAVSQSTKKDLVEKYDLPSDRVRVIYSGIVGSMLRPLEAEMKFFNIENNLPDKFILFLGKLEPRKNVIGLIRAFNLLKNSGDFENLYLIIVGSPGWLYKNIYREVRTSPHKDRIIFKNYIKDEDRKFYYSLASVFIYPSFFEGFGFPPLEAMACGTPVVASFNSSLPEVVGEGGVLVDPHGVVDISMAVKNILTDSGLKEFLVKKGIEKAKGFTWDKCAQETLEVLNNA
ncbi:MAG: glycosyltransferase family 1 protein [Patescibacteria group bacterium]